MTATALQAWIGAVAALLAGALGIVKYFSVSCRLDWRVAAWGGGAKRGVLHRRSRKAVFEGAHLEGAAFREAELEGARFTGAWIEQARFERAEHVPPNVARLLDQNGEVPAGQGMPVQAV